jgi:TusA-related sulfurtransferase
MPVAPGADVPQRLDVTGTLCPVPVLRTERRVRRLAPGALLEVVGDDPLMRLDLAAWCAREGHQVLAMEERDGRVRCLLRVGG